MSFQNNKFYRRNSGRPVEILTIFFGKIRLGSRQPCYQPLLQCVAWNFNFCEVTLKKTVKQVWWCMCAIIFTKGVPLKLTYPPKIDDWKLRFALKNRSFYLFGGVGGVAFVHFRGVSLDVVSFEAWKPSELKRKL